MRRVFLIVLAVLALGVTALVAAPFLMPSSWIAQMAADRVREDTGRELVITGDIERRLYPSLGVTIGAATLSNADWAEHEVLASIDGLEADIGLTSLLWGAPLIETVRLVRPTLNLEVGPNGDKNWEFERTQPAPAPAPQTERDRLEDIEAEPTPFVLLGAEIIDGTIRYTDRATGQTLDLESLQIAAEQPETDGAFSLSGSARVNDQPATLAVRIDSIVKLQRGDPAAAEIALEAPGARLAFDGSAHLPLNAAPRARGRAEIRLSEDPDETAWLRQSLPPRLAPLGAVTLDGDLDLSADRAQATVAGQAFFNQRTIALDAQLSGEEGWLEGSDIVTTFDLAIPELLAAEWRGVARLAEDGASTVGDALIETDALRALTAWASPDAPIEATDLGDAIRLAAEIDFSPAQAAATLDGEATYKAQPITLNAALSGQSDWRDGGGIATKIALDASSLLLFEWDGVARLANAGPQAKGDATLETDALKELVGWLAPTPPAVLNDFDNALRLDANIDYAPDLAAATLEGEAVFKGRPARLTADVTGGANWLSGGDISSNLDLVIPALLSAEWRGVARLADTGPTATGDARLETTALKELVSLATPASPAALDGFGDTLSLSAEIDFTPERAAASLDGETSFKGRPVMLDADLAGDANWRSGGDMTTEFDLSIPALLTVGWNGVARLLDDGPAAQGQAMFETIALKELVSLTSPLVPASIADLGHSMRLDATIDYAPAAWSVDVAGLNIDEAVTQGTASGRQTDRLRIEADLRSDRLDLRPFTQGGDAGEDAGERADSAPDTGDAARETDGWSTEPLDLSALQGVDADIAVTAKEVLVGGVTLGQTDVAATLEAGDLDIAINELLLYGGGLTGALGFDASAAAPALDLDATLTTINIRPLLRDLGQSGVISGAFSGAIKTASSGASLDALMRGLNGSGDVRFSQGVIHGVDLSQLVQNLLSGNASGLTGQTSFADISGTFEIQDGVLRNDDLLFDGPAIDFAGAGAVDLGNQSVDYRLRPDSVVGVPAQTRLLSVLVSGPWSAPSIGPDVGNAVSDIIADPGAALQDLENLGAIGEGGGLEGRDLGDAIGGALRGVIPGAPSETDGDQPSSETPADQQPQAPDPGDLLRGLFGD